MKIKPYLFYGIIFILVILAKIAYTQATNETLVFILKPLSAIISFILGSNFIYTSDLGFYFESLNVTIDKSCSGINFWIISFVVFSVSLLQIIKSNFNKLIVIPITLLATFIFTLFANTSRILTAILIEKHTQYNYTWLHQTEGVFVYISLLLLAYIVFNHIISKFKTHHAKLT